MAGLVPAAAAANANRQHTFSPRHRRQHQSSSPHTHTFTLPPSISPSFIHNHPRTHLPGVLQVAGEEREHRVHLAAEAHLRLCVVGCVCVVEWLVVVVCKCKWKANPPSPKVNRTRKRERIHHARRRGGGGGACRRCSGWLFWFCFGTQRM